MENSKTKVMLCLLILITTTFALSVNIPIAESQQNAHGPRLDELYGHYIESPAAQMPALTGGSVDIWPDIRDPVRIRTLEDQGYEVVLTPEAFLYYHMDFNVRNQVGFNGTHIECSGGTYCTIWRNSNESNYYTYQGGAYKGYAPLDDIYFRHACAHCIPKDEIVATVYGGISAAAIDSLIPEAQRAWYTPGVDGHPLALGNPLATTVWDGNEPPTPSVNHDACSILRAGGYKFEPTAPNPAPKYSGDDPDGNWLDPHLHAAVDDPETSWNDTLWMPMNHMTFAGVTQSISPDSYGRDMMCYRDLRSIGLPVDHEETDYGYLTDTMMDFYQYDIYTLGWGIGRFPDHLYSFFHSDNNFVPEGYNIPGVMDPELDQYCWTVEHGKSDAEIKEATANASKRLAHLCVSIPTITRPLCIAAGKAGAPSFTDSVGGIVNVPGYGADTSWTYTGLYWHSDVGGGNPYGIGGNMSTIVPSEPTNYHPGFASTTDEWIIMQEVVEGLTDIDPYTHETIPWIATSWDINDWNCSVTDEYNHGDNVTVYFDTDHSPVVATEPVTVKWNGVVVSNYTLDYDTGEFYFTNATGYPTAPPNCTDITMNYTSEGQKTEFWIRNDVYWHDGAEYNASSAEFSLEWLRDMQIARYQIMWQHLIDVVVNNNTYFTVYHGVRSPWLFWDISGAAALFPKHIYEGTDIHFRPEATVHPDNENLTCLIGTGPFVFRGGELYLGGHVRLTAFRDRPECPLEHEWWQTVEGFFNITRDCFHWVGDSNSDGIVDIKDLTKAGKAFARQPPDPKYDAEADTNPEPTYHENDNRVDMKDVFEISKNWGKQRSYA